MLPVLGEVSVWKKRQVRNDAMQMGAGWGEGRTGMEHRREEARQALSSFF